MNNMLQANIWNAEAPDKKISCVSEFIVLEQFGHDSFQLVKQIYFIKLVLSSTESIM